MWSANLSRLDVNKKDINSGSGCVMYMILMVLASRIDSLHGSPPY